MESLYERLGGEKFMRVLLSAFYDNLKVMDGLEHFFALVPEETIKTHHAKFFKMLFGPTCDQPPIDDIMNYLLLTHSLLFRNDYLNETHFDLVATCLVNTLLELFVDQEHIDECVAILVPFREVFAYGAKVAQQEMTFNTDQQETLPICSAATMGTDKNVILPHHPMNDVPSWLLHEIQNVSKTTVVLREWTSNLSDRCSLHGDLIIADTLMDIPFPKYEYYISSFLQLAFISKENNHTTTPLEDVIKVVQFPRGIYNPPLSLQLYDRMIEQFQLTCIDMHVNKKNCHTLVQTLRKHRCYFHNDVEPVILVHGIRSDHSLIQGTIQRGTIKSSKSKRTIAATTIPSSPTTAATDINVSISKNMSTPSKTNSITSDESNDLSVTTLTTTTCSSIDNHNDIVRQSLNKKAPSPKSPSSICPTTNTSTSKSTKSSRKPHEVSRFLLRPKRWFSKKICL